MDYQTAIRGAFFDIAQVCDSADAIARHARYLEDGLLFIQNGKILAHMPWQEGEQYLDPQKGYTDLRGRLLLPGFVDTHVHYPQTEMIGAFGEQLLEWLTTYTFPVESQFSDEAYAKEIAEFFIQQLVSNGTTTALVFCTLHPESVEALVAGIRQALLLPKHNTVAREYAERTLDKENVLRQFINDIRG